MKSILLTTTLILMFSTSHAVHVTEGEPQTTSSTSLGPEASDDAPTNPVSAEDAAEQAEIDRQNAEFDRANGLEPDRNNRDSDQGEPQDTADMDSADLDRSDDSMDRDDRPQRRRRVRHSRSTKSTGNEGLDDDIRAVNNDHGLCKVNVIKTNSGIRFHIQSRKTNCRRYSKTTRKPYGFFNSALSMHGSCERKMLGCRILNGVGYVVDSVVDAGSDAVEWLDNNRTEQPDWAQDAFSQGNN